MNKTEFLIIGAMNGILFELRHDWVNLVFFLICGAIFAYKASEGGKDL